MKPNDLRDLLQNLSFQEKLDAIEFLVGALRNSEEKITTAPPPAPQEKKAVPPPSPQPKEEEAITSPPPAPGEPGEKEAATSPPHPPPEEKEEVERPVPEGTIQLSINDLVEGTESSFADALLHDEEKTETPPPAPETSTTNKKDSPNKEAKKTKETTDPKKKKVKLQDKAEAQDKAPAESQDEARVETKEASLQMATKTLEEDLQKTLDEALQDKPQQESQEEPQEETVEEPQEETVEEPQEAKQEEPQEEPQEALPDESSQTPEEETPKEPAKESADETSQPPGEELLEEEDPDRDQVFEELVSELEDHEFPLLEMLGQVRQNFWEPLRKGFRHLDVTNLQTTLESLEFAPLRIAIGGLVKEVAQGLVEQYQQYLEQQLAEKGASKDEHQDLFVTSKSEGKLSLGLRAPFREYIERLERLDEARDALLEALNQEANTFLVDIQSPLLPAEKKDQLNLREEAQAIEGAWMTLLEAIREAYAPYTFAELNTMVDTMEQFLSQLEHIYAAVLYRVLDLWNEQLLAPAKEALD